MALQRRRGAGLSDAPGSARSLLAGHLTELLAELRPLLTGALVREVQALPPKDLLLILVPAGDADGPPIFRLRVSAGGETARLHLQQGRVRSHAGPPGPFFQTLEAELAGSTLRRLEQVGGDRIALLEFGSTPSGRRRALVAELVGRHANLVLLGPDDVVMERLVPAPRGRDERLKPGSPWSPPGGSARAPAQAALPLEQAFPDPPGPPPGPDPLRAPHSWRVECSLGEAAQVDRLDSLRKRLLARVRRKLSRARGLVKGLQRRVAAIEAAERVRQDGELLKSAVGSLRRGQSSVEVPDWFCEDAPPRSIELDPRRSPSENVQRLFDRYKKLLRGRDTVERELALARDKVALLEALLMAGEDDGQDPEVLDREAVERGLLDPLQEADPRKRRPPAARVPYRSYQVAGGCEVRVGRTAKDNDALTFHHARGNDLWLHTADRPGSHVVLRLERGQEPPHEALLEAGMLALHFSPARDAGRGPVHLARVKEVHKPRGAKAGLVTLSGGRTLQVRVQQERLNELLRGDTPS